MEITDNISAMVKDRDIVVKKYRVGQKK